MNLNCTKISIPIHNCLLARLIQDCQYSGDKHVIINGSYPPPIDTHRLASTHLIKLLNIMYPCNRDAPESHLIEAMFPCSYDRLRSSTYLGAIKHP